MPQQNQHTKETFNKIEDKNFPPTPGADLEKPKINPETKIQTPAESNITEIEKTEPKSESIPEKQSLTQEDKNFLEEGIDSLTSKLKKTKKKPTQIPQVRDEMAVQIEKIMEEDLGEAFNELTPIQKQEFKIKGEESAQKIRHLVKKTHIKVKNIFRLILEWLKMLPGVNKFFLEQEAKIKTDKIISLKNRNNKG